MKAGYVVIDIETLPDNKEFEYEASLLKAPSTWKDPVKIANNIASQKELLKSKMALKDSAKISCIGIKSDLGIFEFTTFPVETAFGDYGINVFESDSENQELMLAGQCLENLCSDSTKLVTFNGWGFDLPKLRLGFARSGMAIPSCLFNDHVDLMHRYSKSFSTNKAPFVSLSNVVTRLRIADGKIMKGEAYFDLIKNKEFGKAVIYNVLDLLLTEQVFFRIG